MAARSTSAAGGRDGKSYFEQQREALIGEIAMSFEHVLANINKLNRSLEAVVAVGNEFSSVEALWSQFENVMAKDDGSGDGGGEEAAAAAAAEEGGKGGETADAEAKQAQKPQQG
ncbi:DASH complex subunit Dad1-domain-containing protein [Xylariaceae sp. FL0804]|nr:DASH complex subunit Dad1-domain-containing protein [Xylariaceae sp. FL0804]